MLPYEPELLYDWNKTITFIEGNVLSKYAKFQFLPPYGFREEDFLICFENLPFMLPRQPIKFRGLDKSGMKRGGLLNKHFCKKKSNIFNGSISTFPIISLWKLYVAITTRVLIRPE